MTPFHSYSDEEESLINRDGRDAKSKRKSSSSSSSSVIRAAVLGACVTCLLYTSDAADE